MPARPDRQAGLTARTLIHSVTNTPEYVLATPATYRASLPPFRCSVGEPLAALIEPHHTLLLARLTLKLSDFGLSVDLSVPCPRGAGGTPLYGAAEALSGEPVDATPYSELC